MSTQRRRRSRREAEAQRVSQSVIASPRLLRPSYVVRRVTVRLPVRSPLEDNRRFHPDGVFRRPETFGARDAARVRVSRSRPFRFPDVFRFAKPDLVVRCVRRKERREVLHAIKKVRAGRGRSRKRNYWSQISCQ